MSKKQKKILARIIISAIIAICAHFIPMHSALRLSAFFAAYLVIGYDILIKAARGIINRRLFNESFLMSIATLGAFALAIATKTEDYFEGVAVMLFYQIGELFQSYAVSKSRKNIGALMDIRPDHANIERDGRLVQVSPDEVEIGSVIIVQPGERVPLDGIVTDGESSLNMSMLTGESLPRDVRLGDEIISGSVVLNGVLRIKVTKSFCASTVSKILELVENASARKAKSETFIARFAKIYTPTVCLCALMLGVAVPLGRIAFGFSADFLTWLYRGLTFLVVSCPCALVISIPLTFFAGLGGASKAGVLIKGSNYLEALSNVKYVVFDKTGTLTQGSFEVTEIKTCDLDDHKLLEYAAYAECASSHPISKSLQRAYKKEIDRSRVSDIREIAGKGVFAKVDGKAVSVGNERLMRELDASFESNENRGTVVYVTLDSKYVGYIVISDSVKESAKKAVYALKKEGIEKTFMLTGDSKATAERVANELSIDEFRGELLPADKVEEVERLILQKEKAKRLAFVGDGINDAPVLVRADIGIAMGALGSDAAIEAADVVLMNDDPIQIVNAIKISKRCVFIVRQNIVFSLAVKFVCLALSAFGLTNMWLAIFADVGVMILAVLNAIRALKKL